MSSVLWFEHSKGQISLLVAMQQITNLDLCIVNRYPFWYKPVSSFYFHFYLHIFFFPWRKKVAGQLMRFIHSKSICTTANQFIFYNDFRLFFSQLQLLWQYLLEINLLQWFSFIFTMIFVYFSANCIVMALDEHLPNGDKTILALQLVRHFYIFSNLFS